MNEDTKTKIEYLLKLQHKHEITVMALANLTGLSYEHEDLKKESIGDSELAILTIEDLLEAEPAYEPDQWDLWNYIGDDLEAQQLASEIGAAERAGEC